MRWLALAERQRSITIAIRSWLILALASDRVSPVASLFGRNVTGNSSKLIRVGSDTPGPNANASRVPRDGMKDSRFLAASDAAERINAWSRSFDSLITNSVEHCDTMVASISAGRCVTRPRKMPYLRPSLAIRDSARRVG